MFWYRENVDTLNGKYLETINFLSCCWENKEFLLMSLIFNHKHSWMSASYHRALSASPHPSAVPIVSCSSPVSPTLFSFHSVSHTSSVFKVQITKAGCLSPEAVIDQLTKKAVQGGRVSQGSQKKKTPGELVWTRGSISVCLGASLLARDTWDTRDEMTDGERRTGKQE